MGVVPGLVIHVVDFSNVILSFLQKSDKHRAREPRHVTHELSHESAHENAHRSVHEHVHGNAHEGWGFLCKTHQRVPAKTPTRVLTGNFPVLMKMYQKRPFVHNSFCSQFLLRVCSQFWLSVRNSVCGPFNRNSRGNPSFCWLAGGG